MTRRCVVVKATTTSSIEPLQSNRALYAHNLFRIGDKLKSFQSYLMWICVDQFDAKHTMIF
ncbi:hypothetical protein BHE74_00049686 [Ensete ventricosum]|uniref:Uncharacterized protein n=1 Tax=Ensete ventricosum TaxID=4639 RepID=A0A444D5I0_ENSVE|nr:hypothetical protein B296_00047695 [Ensete ventricosum]RWV93374.1 hypothetical protein GW17_00044176 [Ensete ventricosum]RWW44541.1 hypothetical protein BHE74_00049686 [Ensete ventricosum]